MSNSALRFDDYVAHRNGSVWKCGVVWSEGLRVAVDVLGMDAKIDRAVEAILTHPAIVELLTQVLGTDMRLAQVTIREATRGDRSLSYHQDSDGELGLGVLLMDCESGDGTTTFVLGSHRVPATIRELFVLPRLATWLVPPRLVKPGSGRAGDAYVFFNRTWHARPRLRNNPRQVALLISLFPAGKSYQAHQVDRSISDRIGATLCRLTRVDGSAVKMDRSRGVGGVVSKTVRPVDREVRQILTLDPFLINLVWRRILTPWIAITRILSYVIKRMTGRG